MAVLYDVPNWLLGFGIVGTMLALSLGSYWAFWRLCRPDFSGDEVAVATALMGVLATISALLLAFSAVSAWDSFGEAEESVVREANTVSALARDLAVYDSPQSQESRALLRQYAQSVVNDEWPDMQRGQASAGVWSSFDRMFAAVGTIEPDTARRVALLPEIWDRTNELLEQRRSRLFTSESGVPDTLWAVAVIGTALTIMTSFVLRPTRFNRSMIALLVTSMGLVFWLIVAMNKPFAGQESISPEPFDVAIQAMERWDAASRPQHTRPR